MYNADSKFSLLTMWGIDKGQICGKILPIYLDITSFLNPLIKINKNT